MRRTKGFAFGVIELVERLPNTGASNRVDQLIRAATSAGANYRASCRARSRPDFISKMKIVEEECDESLYWLELPVESGQARVVSVAELMSEGNEILSMTVASIRTARSRQ